MSETTAPVKDFDIIIGDGTALTNADVPVRWCVSKELMAKLKNTVDHPYVVFATIDERGREMSRLAAPLEDLMAYVRFERPGVNTLVAMIVDNKGENKKTVTKRWTAKEGRYSYQMDVVDTSARKYRSWSDSVRSRVKADCAVDVDIPTELFAKEPSKWLMDLVNLWHEAPLRDQCHFRQRLLLTIFAKGWVAGIVAGVMSFINLVSALFAAGMGFKNVNWRSVPHPFTYALFMHAWEDVEPTENWLIFKRKAYRRTWFFPPLMLAPTFFAVFFGLVSVVVAADADQTWALGSVAIAAGTMNLILFGIATIIFVVIEIVESLLYLEKADKAFSYISINRVFSQNLRAGFLAILGFAGYPLVWSIGRYNKWMDELDAKRVKEMYEAEDAILCPRDPDNLIANYYALPKSKKTAKLRFQQIKNKVCRPMPKV